MRQQTPPRPRRPGVHFASGPFARFEGMTKWPDEDEESQETQRNETMPAMFTDSSHIDSLCDPCRSIPWSHIRQIASEKAKDLEKELPKKQQQSNIPGRHWKEIYKHVSKTTQDTADTAVAGCHLCTLVLFVLFSRARNVGALERMFARLAETLGDGPRGSSLVSWECEGRIELLFAVGRRDIRNPFGLSVFAKVPERSVSDYTDLRIAMDPAQSPAPSKADRKNPSTTLNCAYWLDICTKGHKRCTEDEESVPPLPRRIVRVSKESDVISARIYSAAGHKARYAALSHRWSSSSSAQLRKENIREFEQSINLSELSRTFVDAFKIILDVGLEYIWIDSLCIVQDSKEDWARQSACMSSIYGQAYLTLCAFTADNGTGLCSANFKSTLIDTSCQVAEGMYVYPYPQSSHRLSEPEGTAQTRAWIMQEVMLSRRKLYCGEKGCVWVCRTMHSTTNMPFATPIPKFESRRIPFLHSLEPWVTSGLDASWLWEYLVKAYTKRQLSYQSDKLPALSALAERFGQEAAYDKTDYLSGHWRQHLPDSLLWMHAQSSRDERFMIVEDPVSSARKNAPTWSWASQDGPVKFQRCPVGDTKLLRRFTPSRFLHATTVLKTSNPFGEVSSCILRLQGPILRDAYQTLRKIEEQADSNTHVAIAHDKCLDIILMEVQKTIGLLLEKVPDLDGEKAVYRRIGICISTRAFLRKNFEDREWEVAIVDIV